jgi:molecular chaperone Hsp33
MNNTSYLQKFMFEDVPVKGSVVVLNDAWQTIAQQQDYPSGLAQLLAELLAANILLTSNLKLTGSVICQIQDNPYFNLVVSEVNSALQVRATAKFNSTMNLSYLDYCKTGRLVVSIDSKTDGNLYQSIIALSGNKLSDVLNEYMVQSEQIQSWFLLAYVENKVVGMLLQQLPDVMTMHVDDIQRIFMLADTLNSSELAKMSSIEDLLYKLFNQDNVRLFAPQTIEFACSCNRERLSSILLSLGQDELTSLINEERDIMIDCDYCHQQYVFTSLQLSQLLISEQYMVNISKIHH